MRIGHVLTSAIAIGAIVVTTAPAFALDNIVLNQWYTGSFIAPAPSALVGGSQFYVGTHGPVLPGGFADAVVAPGAPWTITLLGSGTLTVTDFEASGDQFQLFDNGVAMNPAASPFTALGQNPGQAALAGGFTSNPTVGGNYTAPDINAALGDANFSSGTFALNAGVNVITGTWLLPNNQSTGDFNFIAEAVPEPSTWAMMLAGFAALGFAGYRRNKAASIAA
jgi:hypothetical protein